MILSKTKIDARETKTRVIFYDFSNKPIWHFYCLQQIKGIANDRTGAI